MIREQLTDLERSALIEAAMNRLASRDVRDRDDLVTAMTKLLGTDTEVIVIRAYPSLK